MKDIHDVIKLAKFGDDRLRGSGVVAGQISAFPIDFAGRPYNTLTLLCERVIVNFTVCYRTTIINEHREYIRKVSYSVPSNSSTCTCDAANESKTNL